MIKYKALSKRTPQNPYTNFNRNLVYIPGDILHFRFFPIS